MTGDGTTAWQQAYGALKTGAAIRGLLAEVSGEGLALTPSAEGITVDIAFALLLSAVEEGHALVSAEIAAEQRTLGQLLGVYDAVDEGGS